MGENANAPPEMQGKLRAQVQREHEALARQLRGDASSVGRTLSPIETQAQMRQATQVLRQLETGIQQQLQARLQQVNTLPPEIRQLVAFEAQVQRDRMLVNAYRHMLSRVTASTL